MKNKVIVFDYEEGWMILLYKDEDNTKYWNFNEDDWEDAWEYISLLKEHEEVEIIEPKLKTYDAIGEFKKEFGDIFNLTEKAFEYLRSIK